MINLIASDVDGTLLQDGIREVSGEVKDAIRNLKENGVIFAVASGRQYPNLRRLFAGVEDDIAYICENGALIKYKRKTVSKTPVERYLGMELMGDIMERDNCELLLSGEDTSYLLPKKESFVTHMKDYVANQVTVIKDLREVTEPFLKISIYNESGIEQDENYFNTKWNDRLTVAVSGQCWLDFTNKFVNKGNALVVLQKLFGVDKDSTMSFGDNYNDIPMFQESYYSYAIQNSDGEIRQAAKHITPNVESILNDVLRMR